jgi:hypothetical protein
VIPVRSLASVAVKVGFVENPTASEDANKGAMGSVRAIFGDKWAISCRNDRLANARPEQVPAAACFQPERRSCGPACRVQRAIPSTESLVVRSSGRLRTAARWRAFRRARLCASVLNPN